MREDTKDNHRFRFGSVAVRKSVVTEVDGYRDDDDYDDDYDDQGDAEFELEVFLPHVFSHLVCGLVEQGCVVLQAVCSVINVFQHLATLVDGFQVVTHHTCGVIQRALEVLQLRTTLVVPLVERRWFFVFEFTSCIVAEGVVRVISLCA